MANRVQLNDEVLEAVSGGNITFDWDGKNGNCGLNGDKSYSFTSRNEFVSAVVQCYQAGMTDAECFDKLVQDGVVKKN